MKKIEKIKLNPYETTAYYWINLIKEKIDELGYKRNKMGYSEIVFFEVFKDYSDADWKKVYNYLVKNIEKEVNESEDSSKLFLQSTRKGRHDLINKTLEMAVAGFVPDINLNDEETPELIISTTPSKAFHSTRFREPVEITGEFDPSFIIEENEEKTDFYKSLLTTLYCIQHQEYDFESIDMFQERFCDTYMKDHDIPESERETILENIRYYFEYARARRMILSDNHNKVFRTIMKQKDVIGLDGYFGKGIDYSKKIAYPNIEEKELSLQKKRNE